MKDKADGPNCVAGPCSQQWPFEANFPAHGAEKDRERRVERLRDSEESGVGGGEGARGAKGRGWQGDVLGMGNKVSGCSDVKKCTATAKLLSQIFLTPTVIIGTSADNCSVQGILLSKPSRETFPL